jgi:hypothetical protein
VYGTEVFIQHRVADELGAPAVVLDEDLWDRTDLDRISKLLGWAPFRPALVGSFTGDEEGRMFFEQAVFNFCPQRIVASTAHLSDDDFVRYLHVIARYAAIVWALRSLADVEERQRLAEAQMYADDEQGFRMIDDIAWRAAS